MSKFPHGGNLHGSNASATPIKEPSYGKKPLVGQSKPYVSGANAHGKHEKPTKGPAPGSKSGTIPLGGPYRKD